MDSYTGRVSDGFQPVVYRTPITGRDLRRIERSEAHVHLTLRRRPPHLTVVLVPRGRSHWPTSWASYACRLYLEPSALEVREDETPPGVER